MHSQSSAEIRSWIVTEFGPHNANIKSYQELVLENQRLKNKIINIDSTIPPDINGIKSKFQGLDFMWFQSSPGKIRPIINSGLEMLEILAKDLDIDYNWMFAGNILVSLLRLFNDIHKIDEKKRNMLSHYILMGNILFNLYFSTL